MSTLESTIKGVTALAPLCARLDAAGCADFRERLSTVLARGQTRVVCDLSTVTFMDSTGLSVLLTAVRALAGRGRLAVCGVNPQVRKLFEITRLDRGLLEFYPTVDDAADALASGQEN